MDVIYQETNLTHYDYNERIFPISFLDINLCMEALITHEIIHKEHQCIRNNF